MSRADGIVVSAGAKQMAATCGVDIETIPAPNKPQAFIGINEVLTYLETARIPVKSHVRRQLPLFVPLLGSIRVYQLQTALSCISASTGGFMVAPCASGKTLMGLLVAVLRGGRFLIVTTRYAAQWRATLTRFFAAMGDINILLLGTGDVAAHTTPDVVIATYTALACRTKTTKLRFLKQIEYNTIVLDEAHSAASPLNLELVTRLRGRRVYALTATKVREDDELEKLETHIGRTLVDIDRCTLVASGHISDVECVNLLIPYTPILESAVGRSTALALHPNKMQVLRSTLLKLCEADHKIIVFCDDLFCLEWTHAILRNHVPVTGKISMQTPFATRCDVISRFSNSASSAVLLISRTGDEALDIPNASAAVVFWNHWASRRQIVQRVGRISRMSQSSASPVFLVLLSDDEKELEVSRHREDYLLTHGYQVSTSQQQDSIYGTALRPTGDAYAKRLVAAQKKWRTGGASSS